MIDARSIGTGLGLVVLAAAAAALAGQGLDEAAAAAVSHADLVGSFFALDQLDALYTGGRLPTAPPASKDSPAVRLVSRARFCGSGPARSLGSSGYAADG